MENQPKISTPVAALLITGALIIDIIPIILIFFGLPDFFIPGLISFLSLLYLKMKGMSLTRDLAASIIELIPYVSVLPVKTAVMIITIWIDRHPTGALAQTVQKTAGGGIRRGIQGASPKAAVPGVKSPIGSIPAPTAPQIAFAKTPTQGYRKAA